LGINYYECSTYEVPFVTRQRLSSEQLSFMMDAAADDEVSATNNIIVIAAAASASIP